METFSALLAICAGKSPVTGEIPAQKPVTRSLGFSLICAWINSWINNGDAGDLRRHRARYDDTVINPQNTSTLAETLAHELRRDLVSHLNDI